jgi:DNA-binding CsgD family transcriptional regulator
VAQGDFLAADGHLRASLAIQQELGDLAGIALVLERYVGLAIARSDPARAIHLAAAAAALRDLVGIPLAPAAQVRLDRALQPAWQLLGPKASNDAWTAGHALTLEDVIADALATLESSVPTATRTSGGAPATVLTRRETQVAVLIGRGYTNRQIAGELFITQGTVANHVVHILDKLSYNSRTQVAVWAADRGLLTSGRSK